MISTEIEQRSEVLKIAGFALLTPFGRVCMEPIIVFKEFGLISFILYLIFTLAHWNLWHMLYSKKL